MNVSMRQLRAFLHLCEMRSFTRAAEASHLSQPAFSALISGLEDALGLRLFNRNTRSVSPTVEGLAFEPTARRLVLDFDAALQGVQDHVTRKRGRVTVALLPSLAANWMPGILAAFHARHPRIDLNLFDVLSDDCIDRVASGEADFAIAASCENTPTLQADAFCSDGFFLVCSSGHPLLTQEKVLAEDLAQWPFIHLARSSSVRQRFDAALYPHAMHTMMEVEQLATVMGMVRAGLGISVVPGLSLFHFERTGVAVRRLDLPGLRRNLYVIRPRDRSLSLAAQSLFEMMQAQRPCDDG